MNVLDRARGAVIERKSLRDMQAKGHDVRDSIAAADHAIREAGDVIDTLNDAEQRAVCRYRYLLAYTWSDTAAAMGCDMSTVFRRHNRALEKLGLK